MTLHRHLPAMANIRTGYLATVATVCLAIGLLIASAWFARSNLVGVLQSDRLSNQITRAQLAAEQMLSTLKDAETGQRGYLLTSDPAYLAPYDAARTRIGVDLVRIGVASLGDPLRDRRIRHIRELAIGKLSELAGSVVLVQSGHLGAAIGQLRSNIGNQQMEAIRTEVDALQADNDMRLEQVRASTRSVWRWGGVVGLDALAAALLAVVALAQRRARLRLAATLARLQRFTRAFGLTQGFMRDLEGRIIFWSVGAERLYGYPQSWAMGRISQDLLRTVYPQPLPEVEAIVLQHGFWQGELARRRADGSEVHVASHWAMHRGEAGEADAIIEINSDITELKRQIDERLRTQEMLRRSQHIETVGKLAGGIAHDFNNLLGVITLNAESLLEDIANQPATPATAEAAEQVQDILRGALSGAQLTQGLLTFARQGPVKPQWLDLNLLLPRHVAMLNRMLGETIVVEARLAPGLWQTRADPSQVGNALLNLALNARDAMPDGGRLTIETANLHLAGLAAGPPIEAPPGDYVMLAVTDTGTGMTPGVIKRATEAFFTTKPPASGSGLGLNIIEGYVRQCGGRLGINSEVGVGTTIRLYLPRAQKADATGPGPQQVTPPDVGGHEAILVVDDNLALRDVARRQLSALGYRVGVAEHGPAALELLRSGEEFDLLFTDVVMPCGMTGYELAGAAQQVQPGLKVLFTTGYTDAVAAGGNEDPPARPMLRKPYRRGELAQKIRAVLAAPQVGRLVGSLLS